MARNIMHPRLPEEWDVEKRYHSEFGDYVWQPVIPGARWMEPMVTEKQAWAFLEGVWWTMNEANRESL